MKNRPKIDYDKLDPKDVPMAKALDAMIDEGMKTVEKLKLLVAHLEEKAHLDRLEQKEIKEGTFDRYLVMWDNPRHVEKCILVDVATVTDLIKVKVVHNPKITRPIMFRKKDELFDTKEQVEDYLERMDLTAAH